MLDSKDALGVVMAMLAAFGAWLGGMRHGRAEFITAVQKAANQVIEQLRIEVARVQDLRDTCEKELANERKERAEEIQKVREEIAEYFKTANSPPPYETITRPRIGKKDD